MWIVVTDLDGTLLNHGDYSRQGASEALQTLEACGIPVVFCTSKTRVEVEVLRCATGNSHPFIVENGGAVYFPESPFGRVLPEAPRRDGLIAVELGTPYAQLVAALAEAVQESACAVRGFAGASIPEVAAWCGFSEAEASLAKFREYDEPFLLDSGDEARLLQAVEARGLRWTKGGRFLHILGNNDKGAALRTLRAVYRDLGVHPAIAALGDSPNDLPLLREADFPIIMPTNRLAEMQATIPHARVAPSPGSNGWGEAVLRHLPEWLADDGCFPRERIGPSGS